MSKIKMVKQHRDSREAARKKVEDVIKPYVDKFGLSTVWFEDVLKFIGKGVDGTLSIEESTLIVDMDLRMPASLAKGRIESTLKEQLDKAFD